LPFTYAVGGWNLAWALVAKKADSERGVDAFEEPREGEQIDQPWDRAGVMRWSLAAGPFFAAVRLEGRLPVVFYQAGWPSRYVGWDADELR
jgi:hypothetical protein